MNSKLQNMAILWKKIEQLTVFTLILTAKNKHLQNFLEAKHNAPERNNVYILVSNENATPTKMNIPF